MHKLGDLVRDLCDCENRCAESLEASDRGQAFLNIIVPEFYSGRGGSERGRTPGRAGREDFEAGVS